MYDSIYISIEEIAKQTGTRHAPREKTKLHTNNGICYVERRQLAQQMNNLIDLRYRFVRNWLQQGQHFNAEKNAILLHAPFLIIHVFFSAHKFACTHAYIHRQTVILMLFNVYCKYARIQSKAILCAHENGQTRKIEQKKKRANE